MNDSTLQNEMVSGRVTMETLLNGWQQFVQALPQDPDQIDATALVSTTRANLQQVGSYLDTVAAGLTAVVPTTSYPLPTIQAYQTNIATARIPDRGALLVNPADACWYRKCHSCA